jgi:hypothetical protein
MCPNLIRVDVMRLALMALSLCLCNGAAVAETVSLESLGVTVTLPEGWTYELTKATRVPNDPNFSNELTATCKTERCETTLETCKIAVYDTVMGLPEGADALAGVAPSALDQYNITRNWLKAAGDGASVAKRWGHETMGAITWLRIETLATNPYKSVLYGRTVYKDRYLIAECRTCEREESRFVTARAIMGSIAIRPENP